jgi:ABC-type phosphate transport system substrate-binding protein
MELNQKSKNSSMNPNLLMMIFMALLSIVKAANAEGTYAIIINAANPVISLSSAEVMQIFLGKKVSWDDGTKIDIVTLTGSDIHQQFIRDYVKKTPQQFQCYWRQMLFTGKGLIPKNCNSDAEMVAFIAKTPGSIGYVSTASSGAPGVKGIQINP